MLVERFIRNQIHRIGVYPYPILPRNAYPDNPCCEVDTPSLRASAVADANVVQTQFSNDRDPIEHLGRANVR